MKLLTMIEYLDVNFKEALRQILKPGHYRNILMVTGKHSFDQSDLPKFLPEITNGRTVTRFNNFRVNPRYEDVADALQQFTGKKFDAILAVGGGSVIDFAKVLSMFLGNPDIFDEHFHDTTRIKRVLPIIALPTTAGSGSEATHFAVIYRKGEKYSLVHKDILPAYTVVDPSLSIDMPSRLTASTGMDAFAQALESCWSKGCTDESLLYAHMALELVMPNLVDAVLSANKDARRCMALGAFYAGKAINITRTTGPHAMSYYLSIQHEVPHGEAVGMNLGYFAGKNYDWLTQNTRLLLARYTGDTGPEAIQAWIKQTQKDTGLRTSFTEVEAKWDKEIFSYLSRINPERMGNNPSDFDPDDYIVYHGLQTG
jgi:alcohol dehydrogenase